MVCTLSNLAACAALATLTAASPLHLQQTEQGKIAAGDYELVPQNEHFPKTTKLPNGIIPILTAEEIAHINSVQSSWVAGENYLSTWSLEGVRNLINKQKSGLIPPPATNGDDLANPTPYGNSARHQLPIKMYKDANYTMLPREFDARQKWFDCQSIGMIRDQGNCGACWAFGTTSAMSDRTCIHSNGRIQSILSARDLMSCCPYCTSTGNGCDGGEPQDAYHFWMKEGLVTGDHYKSDIGCQPYPVPISLYHVSGSPPGPKCKRRCTNTNHTAEYVNDKIKAKEVYKLPARDMWAAMWDIYHYGPITVSYDVYSDFSAYKSGVYFRTADKWVGGHSVTVIGWGEENGIPYWTVKNSWNRLWGHHGFFKIRRGTNECNIEMEMVGGILDAPEAP